MDSHLDEYDITIVGGGYVGLTAAYRISNAGKKVLVIEKESFWGGLGTAIKLSSGALCERYYHHFFRDDRSLSELINELKSPNITYMNSSMGIYSDGGIYSWNGLKCLFDNRLLSISSKIRFIVASFLLAKALLPKKFLLNVSLSVGLRRLYGSQSFNFIWLPMVSGKFGKGADSTPVIWMHGRLKQRLESRKQGKELLGFMNGSLDVLTERLVSKLENNNCKLVLSSDLLSLNVSDPHNISYFSQFEGSKKARTKRILFATTANTANKFCPENNISLWRKEYYYMAVCILIELKNSLSDYYWVNIADTSLFFCGYIEQTRLTGTEEYNGSHVAYLTKYIHPSEKTSLPSSEKLRELAIFCLSKIFSNIFHSDMIIGMEVSVAHTAQAVNDFNFSPNDSLLHRTDGIYLSNISHVFPEERSINNAIKIGNQISSVILKDLS